MRIVCSVRNDGPAETDGATREQGRLSLRKGEGEGEGLSWEKRWLRDSTPHLSPFPFAKGRGGCSARLLPKI
jgi:hypothetical protein